MKVTWWAPRWGRFHRDFREWRHGLPETVSVRILVLSGVVSIAIIAAALAAYPDLDLRFLWWLLPAIAGLYAYMLVGTGLFLVVPRCVTVSHERVAVSHGNSAWIARMEDVSDVRLVVFAPEMSRLSFLHKGRRQFFGLAPHIDPNDVLRYFPGRPRIRDATRRFARLRSRKELPIRRPGMLR
jgi:hypothetical protein